ncbi:putative enzyme related to lactoylglutathione lyase [Okibacterium sp. HSC-33S16]|uniref:VOC family protein n=1 Tax=Okibacterium sp. HSC-33S16 TaxID=2910965 RepID=UPI00209DF5BF|nr:VOC family protein [Okibacterium sp. HSC-33S16]MCP2032686.1 putative enzyme related to lactoylglutathione lyase [Okibacterium sp. HSC-33S16]
MTNIPRTYPHGVSCWIDTEQPDTAAARNFYGKLLGWTFTSVMPDDAPSSYFIAQLDGQDVAAIGSRANGGSSAWNTYFAVTDADSSAATVAEAGGMVTSPPEDAGPGGRTATCRDPQGAEFRLWQPYRRLGAQVVNTPGAWNFSDLLTTNREAAESFYTEVFGWTYLAFGPGFGGMIAVPGYGQHLAATADPDIFARQSDAPPGFADVIGNMSAADTDAPHWQVTVSVADRDDSAARAESLGATILRSFEHTWAALVTIRDPQGAELVLSEFRAPA